MWDSEGTADRQRGREPSNPPKNPTPNLTTDGYPPAAEWNFFHSYSFQGSEARLFSCTSLVTWASAFPK